LLLGPCFSFFAVFTGSAENALFLLLHPSIAGAGALTAAGPTRHNGTSPLSWRLLESFTMCRCLWALLLVPMLVTGDEKSPTYPEPGSDIPGPFHAYNVTGRKKDRFHCLITEQ
jgi:hypothetical protein